MNYQTNKDLAEAQYYLKMLDEFCKTGQVVIPEPSGSVMPWNLKVDPLKNYLVHLFTLEVTLCTGEKVRKFERQVVNSLCVNKSFNVPIKCFFLLFSSKSAAPQKNPRPYPAGGFLYSAVRQQSLFCSRYARCRSSAPAV